MSRPDHNRALRSLKSPFDNAVVVITVGNVAIPPDIQTLAFQGVDQRQNPLAIGTGVAKEDVVHKAVLDRRQILPRCRQPHNRRCAVSLPASFVSCKGPGFRLKLTSF